KEMNNLGTCLSTNGWTRSLTFVHMKSTVTLKMGLQKISMV
ncbi:4079_t:CDS:2, partial [Cetraspora pellucida]